MPRFRPSFLFLALLGTGWTTAFAAGKDSVLPDEPPQLISTQGGSPKWKNTKQLKAYAAKGDPQACFELGARFLDGDDELPVDLTQARTLLETAAAGGVANAQFRLGKIHHDARGVPRDYPKALEYYIAAARKGVPEAQHNIGAMFVSARGVKRDYVEGLAWLLLAERSGAASMAPQQVRHLLAKRPADIGAAEERAKELSADLAHASVHIVPKVVPTPTVVDDSGRMPPPPIITQPIMKPVITSPKIDPIVPTGISPPPIPQPPPSKP